MDAPECKQSGREARNTKTSERGLWQACRHAPCAKGDMGFCAAPLLRLQGKKLTRTQAHSQEETVLTFTWR